MDANPSASQSRRRFRFSLGMLLALVACICCYLAGDLLGYRRGVVATSKQLTGTYFKTYSVDDLVIDADSGKTDYDTLMVTIVEQCSPEMWEEAGGPGRISPSPLSFSLAVNTSDTTHKEITELLIKLRKEKFGADYKYTPGVAAQAARDKASKAN
jgi:hypothetical protein